MLKSHMQVFTLFFDDTATQEYKGIRNIKLWA